jgi:molecular chaperone GrpE
MLKKTDNQKTNSPQTDSSQANNLQNTQDAQKIAELTADLQRTRADFENYRKQMDTQKAQAASFAKYETVRKILPLLDDIDRAIAATPELKPLEKNLEKTLTELKLQKIDSTAGTDFNPDLHDAIMMEESEGEKEVVSETLRAGYIYEGGVIRPAMVKVKNVKEN